MEFVPTARLETAKVAMPLLLRVPEPMAVTPLLNVTVPVGIPAPGLVAETVALKVTVSPKYEGLRIEERAVEVLALETTTEAVLEVAPPILAEPLYTAVMG